MAQAWIDAILASGQTFIGVVQATFTLTGLLWLGTTLLIYHAAVWLNRRAGGQPLLHPLLVTATTILLILSQVQVSVADYQQYAGLLHWLLGPATVALALPMYAQWHKVRQQGWRLVVAIGVAGVIAPALAWMCVFIADAPLAIQMTMLAKSITTPLAMESSRLIGGIPALAAVFVIITGIVGAVVAPWCFRLTRVSDPQAQGVALGAVAHAVGTAKAVSMGEQTAAMASLGLCVNGIMTAIILPLVFGSLV